MFKGPRCPSLVEGLGTSVSDRRRLFNPELSTSESAYPAKWVVMFGDYAAARGRRAGVGRTTAEVRRLGRPNTRTSRGLKARARSVTGAVSIVKTRDWRGKARRCSKVKLTISNDLTRLPRLAVGVSGMNEHGMNEHACVADTVSGALQTILARCNASSASSYSVPSYTGCGASARTARLGSLSKCRANLFNHRGGAT